MTFIKIVARAIRAILGWLGPTVAADRNEATPTLAPLQPDQASVDAPSLSARRGGRPRKHFPDRAEAATGAERVALSRKQRRVAKLKSSFATCFETCFETSPHPSLKSLKNKKGEPHPIPEDWWPDDDGYQLGIEAFGADGVDAAIITHRDTWLSRPERLTDKQWQAKWRAWCRLHIAPSLPLGPQLATRRRKQHGRHEGSSERQHRPNGHPASKNEEWANDRKSALEPRGSESSSDGAAADPAAGDRHGAVPGGQLGSQNVG
jgi:hypothetical protein